MSYSLLLAVDAVFASDFESLDLAELPDLLLSDDSLSDDFPSDRSELIPLLPRPLP